MSQNSSVELSGFLGSIRALLKSRDFFCSQGTIQSVSGPILFTQGLKAKIGELCSVEISPEEFIPAEVVGFQKNSLQLMGLGSLRGLESGCRVFAYGSSLKIGLGPGLLGKVIDCLGNTLDGTGLNVECFDTVDVPAYDVLKRKLVDSNLEVGIRAIDGLLSVGKGQRLGLFAEPGVGKSTILGMIAKNTKVDVVVVALIGERGREVQEFLNTLTDSQVMKKTVVVVQTSDTPAVARVRCLYTATRVAEYFRDQGKDVLLLADSVTRLAMAQREVGISLGEPPVTRGYTASVFSMLSGILERACNSEKGSITSFYSVLLESGDLDDPIGIALRGVLDGHIVLSKKIAEQGHYPAIDVLASTSRSMNNVVSSEHWSMACAVRSWIAKYRSVEDLLSVGAYVKGTDNKIDQSMEKMPHIEEFLRQSVNESFSMEDTLAKLRTIFVEATRVANRTKRVSRVYG